jgi:hypothetical protein
MIAPFPASRTIASFEKLSAVSIQQSAFQILPPLRAER